MTAHQKMVPLAPSNLAIHFEPDGYVLDGPRLMGRQVAGNAFLRAAIDGRDGQAMTAYTSTRKSAEIFRDMVLAQDPAAQVDWVPADRISALAAVGTLYLPGPNLPDAARLRLRSGVASYSLVGVTHTTASHIAMDSIADLLTGSVMPWDALICTSQAVASTVKTVLEHELAQMQWRFGVKLPVTLPQFPIIPLGVHCSDFVFTPEERREARAALGIGEDEVVALFVGRLSFHAKAHPHPMYLALEEAARKTGKKVALIQCGWFPNDHVECAFIDGAKAYCPSVKALFTDGKAVESRRQSWAAADLFISLSDNIQETFGLTPIEAMAAGLPVVVSDWDGYKDTVRDGEDGFRIRTWMPPPGLGDQIAHAHEAGTENYDFYCGLTCQMISVDLQQLAERLADLIGDPGLRARLGDAGRARAREKLDWAVVYRQYKDLFANLGKLRAEAHADVAWHARIQKAPRVDSRRLDPFLTFGHYPTALILPTTTVTVSPGASVTDFTTIAAIDMYRYAAKVYPPAELVENLLNLLQAGPMSIETLAAKAGNSVGQVIQALSVIAKMGIVRLSTQA